MVDKITFEVINSSLTAICRLMGNSLYRTAYSTIIVDCRDFSCAILDREGELIAQQEGCPIHVGTLHSTAKSAFNLVFGIDILSLSGNLITIPNALPLGIIVALCTGSESFIFIATIACPASW